MFDAFSQDMLKYNELHGFCHRQNAHALKQPAQAALKPTQAALQQVQAALQQAQAALQQAQAALQLAQAALQPAQAEPHPVRKTPVWPPPLRRVEGSPGNKLTLVQPGEDGSWQSGRSSIT